MQITAELIDRLAHLSMLSFDEKEKIQLQDELEKMLGFINKLQEVDVTGVKPVIHLSESTSFEREDTVKGELDQEDSFRNAPLRKGDFFGVPKVIKKI